MNHQENTDHADVRVHRQRNADAARSMKGQLDVPDQGRGHRVPAQEPHDAWSASARRPRQINISFGGVQQRIKTRDIVIFTRQFATMINAGLPLVQSLNILAQQTENKALQGRRPRAWCTTSRPATPWPTRCRKHPKAFTDLYVNMVAAGEAGGILDTILLRLATFLEKNDALVRKVKGAMVYPGVIITVAGGRHRDPAHLRHPDLPEHVRVGRTWSCRCRPGSSSACRTS